MCLEFLSSFIYKSCLTMRFAALHDRGSRSTLLAHVCFHIPSAFLFTIGLTMACSVWMSREDHALNTTCELTSNHSGESNCASRAGVDHWIPDRRATFRELHHGRLAPRSQKPHRSWERKHTNILLPSRERVHMASGRPQHDGG